MPVKNYIEVDSWHISIQFLGVDAVAMIRWAQYASRLQQERRRCWYWFRDLFEGKTCKHRGLPGHSIIVPAGHVTRQGTLMVLIDFPTGTRFQKTVKRRCKKAVASATSLQSKRKAGDRQCLSDLISLGCRTMAGTPTALASWWPGIPIQLHLPDFQGLFWDLRCQKLCIVDVAKISGKL